MKSKVNFSSVPTQLVEVSFSLEASSIVESFYSTLQLRQNVVNFYPNSKNDLNLKFLTVFNSLLRNVHLDFHEHPPTVYSILVHPFSNSWYCTTRGV